MAKEKISYEDFLQNVSPENMGFVTELHNYMTDNGCTYKIEAAASGYVFSYLVPKTKKVIMNYVFRKSGMIVRLYGDNIEKYAGILDALPEGMKTAMEKAPACKRLLDPAKCNQRCPMGYIFDLNGVTYKNCRYSALMFDIKEENHAAVRSLIENELKERLSA